MLLLLNMISVLLTRTHMPPPTPPLDSAHMTHTHRETLARPTVHNIINFCQMIGVGTFGHVATATAVYAREKAKGVSGHAEIFLVDSDL